MNFMNKISYSRVCPPQTLPKLEFVFHKTLNLVTAQAIYFVFCSLNLLHHWYFNNKSEKNICEKCSLLISSTMLSQHTIQYSLPCIFPHYTQLFPNPLHYQMVLVIFLRILHFWEFSCTLYGSHKMKISPPKGQVPEYYFDGKAWNRDEPGEDVFE